MSVKIRMKRMGAKKRPFYRIVVADSRSPKEGRFIEQLGYYDPISRPKKFKLDATAAKKWIQNGAQPSDTVARLFKLYSVMDQEGIVAVGLEEKQPKTAEPSEAAEKQEAVLSEKEIQEKEEEMGAEEAQPAEAEEKAEANGNEA